jgi:hypothetical protein
MRTSDALSTAIKSCTAGQRSKEAGCERCAFSGARSLQYMANGHLLRHRMGGDDQSIQCTSADHGQSGGTA